MNSPIFGASPAGRRDIAALAAHGGALDVARRLFPKATQPWLDLSTGINPVAYPGGTLPATCWQSLPEATDLQALESLAGRRYGAPAGCAVVAAPGTQALIQRLPALCGGRDVRVLGHTYGEFERVFRDADRLVRVVPQPAALAGADVAIVVNPNNPDGRLVPADDLLALAKRVGTLVVDEAFIDALPPVQSVVSRLATQRTIVLRSFGKIYGLAGLRLGFALAVGDLPDQLRRMVGPWPISGPALAIGARALADTAWLDAARTRLATDAARLMFHLRHVGATRIGATPLFTLIAHPAAPNLFTALAEAGILTRPFHREPTWLRFECPGSEAGWARLEAALVTFRFR